MSEQSSARRPAAVGLRTACLALATAFVLFAVPAGSVEMPSLYTAQVPLDPDARDPRAEAYEAALVEVLMRISGSQVTGDAELFQTLFPNPSVFVVQFQPGPDNTLWVSFDGRALEQVLRRNGQTVWGGDRPLTMIWLAVDWGQGEREIIGADDPVRGDDEARSIDRNRLLRQRVLDIAQRRGLPVAFPLLDTEDLSRVTFSDIWGGFDDRVVDASRRYDAGSVLIGRVRAGSGQLNRWTYWFAGEDRAWTGEPEYVLSLVADTLAAEFAIGGDAPLETVQLNVAGITTVDAYGKVQQLLSGLAVIEQYSIVQVEGDVIRYRVAAHGGAERLARALRLGGLIEQERFDAGGFGSDPPGTTLDFFYSP